MHVSSKNKATGIRIAEKEAKKSSFKQHRLGAVIVKNGRVLSTGFNQRRYTKELENPTLHAEEDAVLKMLKGMKQNELVGSTIYTTRFTSGGRVGLSRPCSRCYSLLLSVGIKEMVYTLDDGSVVSEKL